MIETCCVHRPYQATAENPFWVVDAGGASMSEHHTTAAGLFVMIAFGTSHVLCCFYDLVNQYFLAFVDNAVVSLDLMITIYRV